VRIGINVMAWAGSVGPAELGLLPGIAALGYDGVELPIFTPEAVDVPAVRRALAAAGLACTVSTALPRQLSLLDPQTAPGAVDYLDRCAAVAAGCGSTLLCGPLYAPVGALPGRPRNATEWETCVAGLRAAGERAAGHGVILAVEVLNRFETHFLNTAGDAVALLDAVAHPAVRLHLDTFHMNVEEKRLPEALAVGMPHLAHVHAAENDRGSPGSGHVDWAGLREGLLQGGYGGWVVAETFTGTIPEIAAATAIWRPVVADGWTFAREAVAFLRHLFPPAPPASR
jgi:D-psicose/D-tagatose/L-ribulose 3-epimerase